MSALDARMRLVAREEAEKLFLTREEAEQSRHTLVQPQPDRVTELEQQVADLTARLDALEKTSAPAKRTARKTASESTE